ncbi:hypothetical protein [Clostridium beijerinckii]|uniref:hypothetical protein n=1 Tax=Clostridium beijerinckii TaxID=1520 RepID=UPI000809EC8B|nr:hypothetical protein [Clostridium beijerinckii]OCA98661.1 hypothetical protein BGS1_11520 [Clostridium beijerinckii]
MEICKKINQKYLNEKPSKNAISIDYNGIKIEYTSNQYKAVPEGYKPTEEEKELFKLDMEVKKQKLVKISQLHGMKMEYLIAS